MTRIRIDAIVLLGALAFSGCGKSTSPDDAFQPMSVTRSTLKIAFMSDPSPPVPGRNRLDVSVKDENQQPVTAVNVEAIFQMPAMPSMGMPEMSSVIALAPTSEGYYQGEGELVMAGTWNLSVRVSRGGEQLAVGKATVIAR